MLVDADESHSHKYGSTTCYAHSDYAGAAGFLKSTLAQPHIVAKFSGIINGTQNCCGDAGFDGPTMQPGLLISSSHSKSINQSVGIDTESWDAQTDAILPCPFGPGSLAGKALCKRFVQLGLGMTVDPARPLVAVISRLVPQKGIHLMEAAMHSVAQLGGQFIVLGTGHADGTLRAAKDGPLASNNDVQCLFMYSEPLSHLLYAAADMFLVPSIFEPCGLTQLIALRFGV